MYVITEKFCSFGRGVFPFLTKSQIGQSAKSGGEGAIYFHPLELRCILHGSFQHSEHPSAEHRFPLMIKHPGAEPQILPMTTCLTPTPNLDLGPQGSFFYYGEALMSYSKRQDPLKI